MTHHAYKWLGSFIFLFMLLALSAECYTLYYNQTYSSYRGWRAEPKDGSWFLVQVEPTGAAAPYLQVGDEVVALQGQPAQRSPLDLTERWSVPPGFSYSLTIRRAGTEQTFTLATRGESLNLANVVQLLLKLIFLVTGLLVFLLRPTDKQAWFLAVMLALWTAINNPFLSGLPTGIVWLVMFARTLGLLFIPVFCHFFLIFPERSPLLRRFPRFELWLYLPFLLTILPVFGLSRIVYLIDGRGGLFRYFGRSQFLAVLNLSSSICFGLYMLGGLLSLALSYRFVGKEARRKLHVVVAGSGLGFLTLFVQATGEVFGLMRYWPKFYENWMWFSFAAMALVPPSFAYAIIRHKVIPVSLIIRRGVRYLLVSRGAIFIESLIAIGLVWLIVKLFFSDWSLFTVIVSAALAILAWRLEDRFHHRFVAPAIDRRFFRQAYDAQRLIGQLSDSLRTTTEVPRLLELVATKLQAALQTESVTILLKEQQSGEFKSAYACEYDARTGCAVDCQRPSQLPAEAYTLSALAQTDEPLELDWPVQPDPKPVWLNNGHGSDSLSTHELQVLQSLRPALLLPLKVKDELSGAVFLGARLGDLPFSSEDKRLVQSVVAPTSLALQNASLIEQRIEDARRREELEAENEARAKELEEARQLQLSMLPKRVPQLPHLEIAAYMKTATEVGGDYYDFHLSSDGTLTVAIGDATGHGLKAGTVVTAMKSLFYTHATEPALVDVLNHSSRVLKSMNLRSLFMALTLVKLTGHELRIASAGMPPALLYRHATNEVEEILMKTMPLGSLRDYPYREHTVALEAGDVLVLMSDGFPERFNAAGEMLGFAAGEQVLRDACDQTAAQIVVQFIQTEERWAQGFAQNDDITFVVLKLRTV